MLLMFAVLLHFDFADNDGDNDEEKENRFGIHEDVGLSHCERDTGGTKDDQCQAENDCVYQGLTYAFAVVDGWE